MILKKEGIITFQQSQQAFEQVALDFFRLLKLVLNLESVPSLPTFVFQIIRDQIPYLVEIIREDHCTNLQRNLSQIVMEELNL